MALTKVETETTILSYKSRENIWNIISDFSQYSKIMQNVEHVSVIEKNGNSGKSEWHVNIEDAPITWIEEDFYDNKNGIISFKSIEGDFETFNGKWELIEGEQGIKIKFTVEYYLGLPVIEEVLGHILKDKMQSNIESMLSNIQKRISINEQN